MKRKYIYVVLTIIMTLGIFSMNTITEATSGQDEGWLWPVPQNRYVYSPYPK